MASSRPNRIAHHRRAKGWSQQQLADAVGVHWVTISKLERGLTKLSFDWAERISKVLEVDEYDLLPPRRAVRRVPISGYVHLGGEVEAIDENQIDVYDIDTNVFDHLMTDWVVVKGDALYPYFRDGDLLGLTRIYDDEMKNTAGDIDFSNFHGRFCMVEIDNNDQFIGMVAPGKSNDKIDLHNANFPPIRNLRPTALMQVMLALMARPSEHKKDVDE